MKFKKMHGLGNDFVIIDERQDQKFKWRNQQVIQICDRNLGIGCDQLVLIRPSKKADIKVIFYNQDGSEAGACGNATRCVADLYMKEKGQETCTIETVSGILPCKLIRYEFGKTEIEVDMGLGKILDDAFTEVIDGLSKPVLVDVGNPHAIYFFKEGEVDTVACDQEDFDYPLGIVEIEKTGPKIESHPFFKNRTNVGFAEIWVNSKIGTTIRLRTWERGAGVTMACGTNACATALAAIERGHSKKNRRTEIIVDGGTLTITVRAGDDHILMQGDVTYVFEGEFPESLIQGVY